MPVLRKLDKPKGWKPESYKQVKYLINVSDQNNNKYYDMYDLGNGNWIAIYGRVEVSQVVEEHPMSDWDPQYKKKIKSRGYEDVTDLRTIKEVKTTGNTNKNEVIDIKDSQVKKLVNDLQNYSNRSIQSNYTVTAAEVTQAQIDRAQSVIDELVNLAKLNSYTDRINENLLSLYKIIPRRMKKVQDHLLNVTKIADGQQLQNFKDILGNEQLTLDVMRGQVTQISNVTTATAKKVDILAQMGLTIELTNANEIAIVKKLLGSNANQFSKAFKIINLKTQKRFDSFIINRPNKTKQLFWHGSRNENWWSILDTGLVLRPTNAIITGKMFGMGSYFANKAQKSLGYSSYRGSYWSGGHSDVAYLALFNVHTGHEYRVQRQESWMSQLTERRLKEKGDYDCLFAKGGIDLRNDEIIVYNEAQSTVNFLVEIK